MKLSSLHLLLTYKCTLQCDHCFVWGSPWQTGKMSPELVRRVLEQAREVGTVESIYFEGGEPFLCYATLLAGAHEARRLGFSVGIVSNGSPARPQSRSRREDSNRVLGSAQATGGYGNSTPDFMAGRDVAPAGGCHSACSA